MPTYEFRCPSGHSFERFYRKMADAVFELPCPECGKTAVRQLSGGAGLVFKGSGFYLTDYGRNAHRKDGAGSSGESKGGDAAGSGESKSGGAGDSKSDAKSADARSGDSKSGDSKSSDSKSSETKSASAGEKTASKSESAKGSTKKPGSGGGAAD